MQSGGGCFPCCRGKSGFLQGALRDPGLSGGSTRLAVKALLTQNQTKTGGKKTPHSHKKHLFCSFFFLKGKGKRRALGKAKGDSSPPRQAPSTYRGRQRLSPQRWHCGARRTQSCYCGISRVWGLACLRGEVGGVGQRGILGTSYLKFIPQAKVPIAK